MPRSTVVPAELRNPAFALEGVSTEADTARGSKEPVEEGFHKKLLSFKGAGLPLR
jgi:hypothetical protein